jgi:hypothetical protein
LVEPPGPLQAREYVAIPGEVGVKDLLPLVATVPLQEPLATQAVASVDDQVSVALVPVTTFVVSKAIVTTGTEGGDVDGEVFPPQPEMVASTAMATAQESPSHDRYCFIAV